MQKEIALSRKSPAPKRKPADAPAPREDATPEQSVAFYLNYISSINRQTLAAIYQLYAAPDCQVGEVPALRCFDHLFEDTGFRALAFVTKPQEDVLEKAANQSIDALLAEAFQVALTLQKGVVAAEQSLVTALRSVPVSAKKAVVPLDDPPPDPPPTGCCYYIDGSCASNIPQDLCMNDPNYLSWAGGEPCVD
jgi:hypothetical protein